MPVIECKKLYRDYAGEVVLRSIDLAIEPGEKVGLVGANGSGKTTLLNALAGIDQDFRGSRILAPGARIGYLTQHIEPSGDQTALEYMLMDAQAAEQDLRASEELLSAATASQSGALLRNYEKAREAFEDLGGYFAKERAQRAFALVGLEGRETTRAKALSGGERGILDEPGNHLDFWGMAWLEEFLVGLKSALLMVSHNRMLLDKTVKRIVEIEEGTARVFSGNYSASRLEKLRAAACQGEDWQASKKKIARLEEMVRRAAALASAHPDKTYGKRLRARRHQLEREKAQAVDRPTLASTAISANFSGYGAADVKSDFALIVNGYSRTYRGEHGEKSLYKDASFDILTGERVALIGPNGCGKTTFLRDLVDHGDWDGGSIRVSPGMRVGYVAQDRDGFTRGRSLREEFRDLGATERELRGLLRDFGFGREDPERSIDSLSGGELNRLQLARAIWTRSNFLVLDEPTNHLDIDARESVEDRLADFDGTILIVSHDRYFIEKVAERIVFIHDGKFEAFEGGFGEFWLESKYALAGFRGLMNKGRTDKKPKASDAALARGKNISRAKNAARGENSSSFDIEKKIVELEKNKSALEARITRATNERDFALGRRLARELQQCLADIERLYASWGS